MINNRSTRCNSEAAGGGTNCRQLMKQLRAVDFSLYEVVLYLDGYPESEEAMKLYRNLLNERRRLAEAYESQCGPLTMNGNHGGTWNWTKGPWPWEPDAN